MTPPKSKDIKERGKQIPMQFEVGAVLEGKVTGIQKFGAFVDIGGRSGMVHISEIAGTYVNDIKDYISEGQTVKVKIINIAPDGKISLSIKKALPQQETRRQRPPQNPRQHSEAFPPKDKDGDQPRPQHHSQKKPVKKEHISIEDIEYAYEPKSSVTDAGFEDMLSKFKMSSEDRISGLKTLDVKKRGRRK